MNIMNKSKFISLYAIAVLSVCILFCMSCASDTEHPTIESVWNNTASVPVEQVFCAYPGQTLCLHGIGFSGIKQITVNNTIIGVSNTAIYDTDSFITFKLPDSVATTDNSNLKYVKVETSNGETTYEPFIIKSLSMRPSVSSVSATTLVAGSVLQIKGSNLDGVQEVYLPLTFEQMIKCKLDSTQASDASNVYVVVPGGVNFASGQLKIVMQKRDSVISNSYTENVYSSTINFKN